MRLMVRAFNCTASAHTPAEHDGHNMRHAFSGLVVIVSAVFWDFGTFNATPCDLCIKHVCIHWFTHKMCV